MDKSALEGAHSLALAAHKHMPVVIDKIRYRRKPIDVGACYRSLKSDHLKLGVYDYLLDGNVKSLKQHFYVASKLVLEASKIEPDEWFAVGNEIFWALFSDNVEVINAIAHVENRSLVSNRDNPLTARFFVHMMQLAIRGEYDELKIKIEKVGKHGRKPERLECASGQDFYSLLIREDKEGLERLIQDKHAHIKSNDPIFEDFLSFQAGWETKLCWLKGIPVQIESPLVPMDLMIVDPLDHYDDVYDFLQPGWEPPRNFFEKLSRWFSSSQKS